MSNVIHVIHHSIDDAKDAKETFEDNYEMYCSWLASFTYGSKDGETFEQCKVIPQSYEVYMAL